MTAQDHLALIDQVIAKRLDGDAFESYTEQQNQFRGTPLDKLYEIRTHLQQEVAMTTGGCFRLGEFFRV